MPKPLPLQRGFTLIEIMVVIVILGVLTTIAVGSFQGSRQKARDAQRKSDLKQIGISLEAFYNDKKTYPVGLGGDIAGCSTGGGRGLEGETGSPCAWGEGFTDANGTVYMVTLPADPVGTQNYYYVSADGSDYKIYARLENSLDPAVVKDGSGNATTYTGTDCGEEECNYGISSPNTTL